MPDGRFLSKTVAHDLELNSVSFEADYIFTRCVPHLDVEGRMPGHPSQVKGMACPLRTEVSVEIVDRALGELATAGLVAWYEVDGRPYLEFPGFSRNQKGLRKDREAESRIPSPKVHKAQRLTTSLRSNSGPTPEEVGSTPDLLRTSEVKVSEVKVSTTGLDLPPPSSGDSLDPSAEAGRQEVDTLVSEPGRQRAKHPELDELWKRSLRESVNRIWHAGLDRVHVHDHEKGVGIGLEYWLCNDLIVYAGDPDFVVWLIEEAPLLLGWDDAPRTLFWAHRPENFHAARAEYDRRRPAPVHPEAIGLARKLSMPKPPAPDARDASAVEDLRANIQPPA